jgi:hypothetical protein
MKIFKKKQIVDQSSSDFYTARIPKSTLYGVRYEKPPHHRRLFPLVRWLQQPCVTQKWRSYHDRMQPIFPRICAGTQGKFIVREILQRSGAVQTNRDGFVIVRWVWLKKLYSWTLNV